MNDLDEKIARGDAGVKIAEERAARRQKDAYRERFNNVLNAVAIGAAAFAVTLLVICFVL